MTLHTKSNQFTATITTKNLFSVLLILALSLLFAFSRELQALMRNRQQPQHEKSLQKGSGALQTLQRMEDDQGNIKTFWKNNTGIDWNHKPFKWVRSNPILPSFSYGFPEKESDQKQINEQQILEPYVSIQVAQHLHSCCIGSDGSQGHFLDVGGNFGWYALLAAASGCDVDSFEPVDWFRYLFETTAKLNDFTSSTSQSFNIHPVIVSDVSGIDLELYIPISEDGLMGAAGVNGMNKDTISKANIIKLKKQTTTIDELGIQPKYRSCAIKVDVEGFEPKVIAGGSKFITKNQPPMIILELSPGMTKDGIPEMFKQLEDVGYSPHLVGWRLIKNPDPTTWLNSLSDYSVEWNTDQIIRKCGYNCMLLCTLASPST